MAETIEYAQDYFARQAASNAEFWARFGGRADVTGKRVLELGCGHGAMTVDLAQDAGLVTGVDLDADRIRFAREHLSSRYPELQDRVRFVDTDVAHLADGERFDVVVSKDTFEHVADVDALLAALHRLLVRGGLLYAGFSPLYGSPFGDHGRTGLRVPWAHAVLPESAVLRRAARHQGGPVRSLGDLGLNGLAPADFRRAFRDSPFTVVDIRYNAGDKRLLRQLDRARRVPALERLATVSMYATLRA